MFKKNLARGDILLVIANLVPVYGVWFLGWNATEVFIVYALQTLIIGIITLLKMLVITLVRGKDTWYNQGVTTRVSGFFFIAFFIIHFGLFTAIQTSIFSQTSGIAPPSSGILYFFFHWYGYINEDIAIMLGVFIIGYLWKSFVPFLLSGEYKTVSLMKVMFQPYGRIVIQQFTVIVGSLFLSFNFGKGFILVFALVQMLFELNVDLDGILNKSMAELEKQSNNQE